VEPIAGAKADGQIIVDMMNYMGYKQEDYNPATLLAKEISQIVPFFAGVTWENLGDNGKQWPVAKDGTDSDLLHIKEFKRGKGKFIHASFKESKELELHAEEELDHVCDEVQLVGINNRDLKTFAVDIDRSLRMAERLPADRVRIAESGIDAVEQVRRFRDHGFHGFLMGEQFMKSSDPGDAFARFASSI
jgi:predicted molibdopterin-dependent oxidoreductase YjgC